MVRLGCLTQGRLRRGHTLELLNPGGSCVGALTIGQLGDSRPRPLRSNHPNPKNEQGELETVERYVFTTSLTYTPLLVHSRSINSVLYKVPTLNLYSITHSGRFRAPAYGRAYVNGGQRQDRLVDLGKELLVIDQ